MFQPHIRVYRSPAVLAQAVAGQIVESAALSIQLTGRFALGLSGGTTPRTLYELLAADPYASRIDWANVEIFFGDERCVPPGHPDSNFRVATEALLDRVPIPYERIHRLPGEIDPQQAALEYGTMLKNRFGKGGLDLTLLGMGDDGHTASLFPNSTALQETEHRCVANWVNKLNAWRLTLSAPFINRSYEVLVLITGAAKAPIVKEVLEGDGSEKYPIGLIRPENGRLYWHLDAAAADM
ncbi:MAG: 6-phosphogluconolactonase [Tepidisphaeraceae bacterium]|jgi:6-phosphogluconolactonase